MKGWRWCSVHGQLIPGLCSPGLAQILVLTLSFGVITPEQCGLAPPQPELSSLQMIPADDPCRRSL